MTMVPPSGICGITALAVRKFDVMLRSITVFQKSRSISAMVLRATKPPVTKISEWISEPKAFCVAPTRVSISASWVKSPLTAMAVPPAASISLTVSAAPWSLP